MADFNLPFVLTLSVSIIAVILSYVDIRRRLEEQQEFSKLFMKLLDTLREELKLFKKHSKGISTTRQELEREKILAQREQQQWKQIKDVARAIGWILEHTEDDNEEDEY